MTNDEFTLLVSDAIASLPEEFLQKLKNVDVVVDDLPTEEQKRKINLRHGMTLFGLYEGTPQTKRAGSYTMVLPDKITIFRKPMVEFHSRNAELIKEQVKKTVMHEIGHHFGMSEEELRNLQY